MTFTASAGFSHGDNMNCVSCHAAWTNTCTGCHLKGQYDLGANFSNVTGERIVFEQTNADFTYQTPVPFQLGVNAHDKIAPITTNTNVFFQYRDINRTFTAVFAFSDRNGFGNNPATAGGASERGSRSHGGSMKKSDKKKAKKEEEKDKKKQGAKAKPAKKAPRAPRPAPAAPQVEGALLREVEERIASRERRIEEAKRDFEKAAKELRDVVAEQSGKVEPGPRRFRSTPARSREIQRTMSDLAVEMRILAARRAELQWMQQQLGGKS